MPTSQTNVTVANRALDIISEFPMATWDDTSVYGRWIRRNFAWTVESALRQQPWNFATNLCQLSAGTTPAYRWKYSYALPNGWVRVLPPTVDGNRNGPALPYQIARNLLLMDEPGPRNVEVVISDQNPGAWDPLFADMIAARLAVGLAHRFTAKNSFVDFAKTAAQEAYEAAELINAFEGTIPTVDQHDIIRVRGMDQPERWYR
jgi:hypothetical protein